MKVIFKFMSLSLICASCMNNDAEFNDGFFKKHKGAESIRKTAGPELKPIDDSIPDFTRSFEGTINNKYKITFHLSKAGTFLTGYYQYVSQDTYLTLEGKMDKSGKIILKEFNIDNENTGEIFGRLTTSGFSGTFVVREKEMPINLTSINNLSENNCPAKFDTSHVGITEKEFSKDTPGPKFIYVKNIRAEKLINETILREIKDVKKCAGACEYLISKDYLQIQIRNECVKFSQYNYLLFDLRNGNKTHPIELFRPEKRKELLEKISKTTLEEYVKFDSGHCYVPKPEKIGWKDFEIVILKSGISFQYNFAFSMAQMDCDRGNIFLRWYQLNQYIYR